MKQTLALALLVLLAPACAPGPQYVKGEDAQPSPIVVIGIDGLTSYLIDPRTETCVLRMHSNGFAVTPVSCALLKRNVPQAAPHITWVADTAAAPH